MLGIMSSTLTRLRNHGKHPLHKECHCLIPMLSGLKVQFIHLRTANLKSFHTTSATMLSTMSSTTTRRRKLGKLTHQMVCHSLAPIPFPSRSLDSSSSCQSRRHSIVTELRLIPRSFHTWSVIMHGTSITMTKRTSIDIKKTLQTVTRKA